MCKSSSCEAKQRLGEIADRALEAEQIVIVRKSKLLVLEKLEIPEPVPLRPHGYVNALICTTAKVNRDAKKNEVIPQWRGRSRLENSRAL